MNPASSASALMRRTVLARSRESTAKIEYRLRMAAPRRTVRSTFSSWAAVVPRPSPGVLLALRGRLCNMVINRMHKSGDGDIVVVLQRSLSVVGTSSWVVEDPDDLG